MSASVFGVHCDATYALVSGLRSAQFSSEATLSSLATCEGMVRSVPACNCPFACAIALDTSSCLRRWIRTPLTFEAMKMASCIGMSPLYLASCFLAASIFSSKLLHLRTEFKVGRDPSTGTHLEDYRGHACFHVEAWSFLVELALVLPWAEQEMLYSGPGGFSENSDDATDFSQHIVEVHVGSLDRQLRVRQDPNVDCDLFEVRVFGNATNLEELVGLG